MTERMRAGSGAPWEERVGYSRVVRVGPHVYVTGTVGLAPGGAHPAADDAYAQTAQALDNIEAALAKVGARTTDVVRTRMFVTDIARDWPAIGRAHAERFGAVRPATTMVEVRALIEPWMRVEIEADAVVAGDAPRGRIVVDRAAANEVSFAAALLEAAGLPVPGRDDNPVHLLLARDGGDVVGCIGYERYGERALLRSCAVREDARGRGVGTAMVEQLLARLAGDGVRDVYLLTISGGPFFARLGFTPLAQKTDAPDDVRTSRELAIHACDEAICMTRRIG